MDDDLSWMDGPQDIGVRCAALGAELAYLRGSTVEVTIDDDGIYELSGDIFGSKNLADICVRLEELIAREECKPKAKILGLSNWARLPKSGRGKKAAPVKAAPRPAALRSAQVALSLSMPQIVAMFRVGSKWKVVHSELSTYCSTWTVTKSMPKSLVLQNEYGEWKFSYPSELVTIEARAGYLAYNIANGGTVTMTKEA